MMNLMIEKTPLNAFAVKLVIWEPLSSLKAQPGQFAILRAVQTSERFPLIIADFDRVAGTLTFIYEHGPETRELDALSVGSSLYSVTAPLGRPSQMEAHSRVCVLAGGFGAAAALAVARRLVRHGSQVDVLMEFEDASHRMLEKEFSACAASCRLLTRSGGEGDALSAAFGECMQQQGYDAAFVAGPLPLMKTVCGAAERYDIPITASMNTVIMDGVGICGGCRLKVNGETKLACLDGPEFDGRAVDFDELINRSNILDMDMIRKQLRKMHRDLDCRLLKEAL